ncbi:MAG: Hsp20/alpha crystallin family protein [Candidatus Nanohaloarchaea archaeon]|nr:Hsp20/alpha crystallin family protein [Candidatus Nanohaloarchaea archaeon]
MRSQDPFQEMRKRMEDMFNSFRTLEEQFPETGAAAVPVDIEEDDGTVTVRADLPGVDSDQIDVKATNDALDIRAQHEEEVEEEQKDYYRRERSARRYQRSVALPAHVDPDSAEASYENGVLTVTLDKAEGEAARTVDVE